jgi:hypothetical protein
MSGFDWAQAAASIPDFGGQLKTIQVPKTGLPFFDVLRLYGAVDLFLGLQQSVEVHDLGSDWQATARVREQRLKDPSAVALLLQKGKLRKTDQRLVEDQLAAALLGGEWPTQPVRDLSVPLQNPDSALKDGIRDTAASTYRGLESGYGLNVKIPMIDAILALAGQARIEQVANIYFLPVFEGKVDFSKVVSPLRAWRNLPNVICAKVLTLLALKTSLWMEGYDYQLSAVAFNTNLDSRANYNYSGLIQIDSTALNRQAGIDGHFFQHYYLTFRALMEQAWSAGKATNKVDDALAHAYWLMEPNHPKHLASLITSMERQHRDDFRTVIATRSPRKSFVTEVFKMSYGQWNGDHQSVRKFARVVSTSIWNARQKGEKDKDKQRKAWYDEVTMLRSTTSARSFFERALILIEQGKKENAFIGSGSGDEDFDPSQLIHSIGQSRSDFETFRDLFRMYLILESVPTSQTASGNNASAQQDGEE